MNWIIRIIKQKKHLLYGMGNRCKDGLYILFLDYDDTPLEWITEEIKLLQKRYSMLISTAYIFKTRKGYHVLFLEKNDLEDVLEMMRITSADKQHREIPLYYGRRIWVLRNSPKKQETINYVGCVHNVNKTATLNLKSNAHKEYLKLLYKIPNKDFGKQIDFDNENNLTLAYYHVGDKDA
jgi:hypothetical protein